MTLQSEGPSDWPLVIRAMTDEDIEAAMRVAAALPNAPQWTRSAYESAIAVDGVPERIALVAEQEGAVSGFVIANVIADEAEIESIAVAGECQRKGIASVLLRELIVRLRERGVVRVMLEVRESNMQARGLYVKLGFNESARRRGYYHAPDEDALLLALELSR